MQESTIQVDKNSKISQTGRLYLDVLFDPGEFIYLDNSGKWSKYKKAVEGHCDFFVISRGTNYIEVSKSGFITISQYSSLKYVDRILGIVYLDSTGRLTKNQTETPIGYVDKGTFYVNIGSQSVSNTSVSEQVYEYLSEGPIIDSDVYFSAFSGDSHIVSENSKITSMCLVVEGLGIKSDTIINPLKYSIILENQTGIISQITFDINSDAIGKYYPADGRFFAELSDLNIELTKGDSLYVKFNNEIETHGASSTIVYYGNAKISITTEEILPS